MKTEEQIRTRMQSLEQALERVRDIPALHNIYLREIELLLWVLDE